MKTLKMAAITAALIAAPGLSFAMGCSGLDHDKQAQSCAVGTTWDATTDTCVPGASS